MASRSNAIPSCRPSFPRIKPGTDVQLEVWRDRKVRKVDRARWSSSPEERPRPSPSSPGAAASAAFRPAALGLTVRPLQPEERQQVETEGIAGGRGCRRTGCGSRRASRRHHPRRQWHAREDGGRAAGRGKVRQDVAAIQRGEDTVRDPAHESSADDRQDLRVARKYPCVGHRLPGPGMQERYDPTAVEGTAQADWQAADAFAADESAPGEKYYCLSHVPVPVGTPAHGPCAQLHHRRRAGALHAHAGPQCAAAHGLGCLRPAGRERRHGQWRAAGASGRATTSPT